MYLRYVFGFINLFTRDPSLTDISTAVVHMSSTEPETADVEELPPTTLSNRGNKLTGKENPGSIRPKMNWNKSRQEIKDEDQDQNMDFEVTLKLNLLYN